MKVVSVEPIGLDDVYNMEVADTHDFVVNGGMVAHNCYDETRYFLMMHPLPTRSPVKKYEPAPFDPFREQ